MYAVVVLAAVSVLVVHVSPRYGHTHILVYIGICSLMGSLTVSTPTLGLQTLNPKPRILNPNPETPDFELEFLNPKPRTRNLEPEILNLKTPNPGF